MFDSNIRFLAKNQVEIDKCCHELKQMRTDGLSKEQAIDILEKLRQEYIESNDEEKEDWVLSIMDIVTGFCGAHMKIW